MERPEDLTILLDYAQDKVALIDHEGRFTYVNEAVHRLLGYEPDELLGRDAFEYVHPEDRERAWDAFREAIAVDGQFCEVSVEYRFRTSDGSWVWLESRMSNLTDSALDGYVVSSRDVTERVETETRLEELAAKTGDVLWMFDGDWSRLLFVNPAFEAVYGMSTDELYGDPRRFLECVHPEDVPAVEEAMERLSDGTPVDVEYRVNPAEDYGNWVWVQGEPIVEDGEVVRIVGFTRDVTDRRRRERQLAVMDNLLRHTLRTDMEVILGNAELIQDDPEETPRERAAVIRRTGERLLASAEKQREIIGLLNGPATPTVVDLSVAVAAAVETVGDSRPDAVVETDVEAGVEAHALPELRTALVELIENAIDHADDRCPTVWVTARSSGDRVELTVRDAGPPIPEFDYRVLTGDHEMNDVYHSSGLGLWLVFWIVDLSDGDVSFDYREGNVLTVTLPAG